MLSAEQARKAVVRGWTRALDALAGLDPCAWSLPTRCPDWSVTDLVRHAVWGTSMEADALARARVGAPGSGEGREAAAESDPGTLLALLRSSVTSLDSELASAASRRGDSLVTIPFGPIPLSFALDVFTMEAGVHADDLLDALGVDEPLTRDVVAATSAVLTAVLPVLAAAAGDGAERPADGTAVAVTGPSVDLAFVFRDGGWTAVEDATAAAVPASAVAVALDDTAALRFALGRGGVDAARLAVGPGAAAFKRWFPGP